VIKRSAFVPLICLCLLWLCSGCATSFWKQERPFKLVTLHALTTSAADTERFALLLQRGDGDGDAQTTLWLRRIPVMNSRYIKAMEVVRGPRGMVGIKCHLNRHGQYMWTQISSMYGGRQLAVLVDGELAFFWDVPGSGVDFADSIVLEGAWSREEAAAVAAQARRNYNILN
jgi:preprotein translocase subunit SecD